MIKTVIANMGVADFGKTASLKEVYNVVKLKFPQITPNSPMIDNGDLKAIFTINNIKIGIETQGDPNSRIFSSIDDFVNQNCDIIICACRTSGETRKKVLSTQDNGYRIIWASNYCCKDKNAFKTLNYLYAENIVEIVDRIIKGNL